MDALLAVGLSNAVVASLLAVVAATATRWWRRPALAHGLWLLVLVKLVTPSLAALPLPHLARSPTAPAAIASVPAQRPVEGVMPDPPVAVALSPVEVPTFDQDPTIESPEAAPAPPPEPVTTATQAETIALSWHFWVAFLWGSSSALWFAVAAMRVVRFRRLLNCGSKAAPALQAEARDLGTRLGVRQVPAVWLVPGTVSPLLWAFGGPARLLLPAELWDRLAPDERATLLVHELAHYRRCDHWVRGLEMLATGLFWWHPVTWWARYRLREAEEQCCDAWVVWALPHAARTYAQALLQTLDFLSGVRPTLPPAASAAGHFPLLKRRFAMIVQRSTPRSLSPAGWLAVAALALAALPWSLGQAQVAAPSERSVAVEMEADKVPDPADPFTAEIIRARLELEKARVKVMEAEAQLQRLVQRKGEERKVEAVRVWNFTVPTDPARGPEAIVPKDTLALTMTNLGKDAHQAIAILEAQLAAKKAAVEEAEAVLEKTKRRVERATKSDEREDAASDVAIREAQLRGRKAELQEVEARVVQEKSRLDPAGKVIAIRGVALPTPPTPPSVERKPGSTDELRKKLEEVLRKVDELQKQLETMPKTR